ncbi:MAG: mechanosensitive ion channel domain-containing protein [Bacteroidota bacterium]
MDPLVVEEVVNTELLLRGGVTAGVAVFVVVVLAVLKALIVRFVRARQMHQLRGRFVYRVARVFTVIFAGFVLAYVWGFDPEKLWVLMTGFFGLVAIGFFAVWSLLSNVIAGVFLFLSDPFKISDEIEVPSDDLAGKVLDIRPLFVVLEEPGGHTLYVPNSLLFQKSFRRVDVAARGREEESAEPPEVPESAD